MKRVVNNTRKCIDCGNLVPRKVLRCPLCAHLARVQRAPYIRSPEHRVKMSERLTGLKRHNPSASTRPEVAAKIQAWWTPERREERRQQVAKRNRDAKYRLRYGLPGMLNPNFLNGQSIVPYANGWTDTAKQEILERDNYTCQDCGRIDSLHIHHKDFGKSNHKPSNLITLCHACHFARHAAHRHEMLTLRAQG